MIYMCQWGVKQILKLKTKLLFPRLKRGEHFSNHRNVKIILRLIGANDTLFKLLYDRGLLFPRLAETQQASLCHLQCPNSKVVICAKKLQKIFWHFLGRKNMIFSNFKANCNARTLKKVAAKLRPVCVRTTYQIVK